MTAYRKCPTNHRSTVTLQLNTMNTTEDLSLSSDITNESDVCEVKRGPKVGVKRGPYKTVASFETRIRILDAVDRGEDWMDVAQANGVKPSTARTWISRGSASFKARGAKIGAYKNGAIEVHTIKK